VSAALSVVEGIATARAIRRYADRHRPGPVVRQHPGLAGSPGTSGRHGRLSSAPECSVERRFRLVYAGPPTGFFVDFHERREPLTSAMYAA